MKKYLIIIAFVCTACEGEKELVIYRFTNDDQQKLLSHYTKGKIFSFGDDERKFEVVEIQQNITRDFKGGIQATYNYDFYYEQKRIILKEYVDGGRYVFVIHRYPINVEQAKSNPYKIYPSRLIVKFHEGLYINFGDPTTKLSANGLTFEKVHILDRTEFGSSQKGLFYEAKYIYYDEYYGFVGFNNFDGTQWRLEDK